MMLCYSVLFFKKNPQNSVSPWEQSKVDFGKRLISYSFSVNNVTELYQKQVLYQVPSLKIPFSSENILPNGCISLVSEAE